jgi:hypothetical protein
VNRNVYISSLVSRSFSRGTHSKCFDRNTTLRAQVLNVSIEPFLAGDFGLALLLRPAVF